MDRLTDSQDKNITIFKLAVVAALFLLFILPFTHTVSLRLLALFSSFLIIVSLQKKGGIEFSYDPVFSFFLIWLFVPIALISSSVSPAYSMGEIKTEIIYAFLGFYTLFFMAKNKNILCWSLLVVGASAVIISLWGVMNFYQHKNWLETGYHGGRAAFVTYVATILPLVFIAWASFKKNRFLILVALFVFLVAAFVANQRAFFASVLVITLTFSGYLISLHGASKKNILLLFVSMVVFLVFLLLGLIFRHGTFESFWLDFLRDVRFTKFDLPWSIIKENIWTGVGFGRETMKMVLESQSLGDYWHSHNILTNYAVYSGIWGVLSFLMLLGYLSFRYLLAMKHHDGLVRALGLAGFAMILSMIARNQFNDMFHRDLSLLFWCLQGLILGSLVRLKVYEKVNSNH